MASSTAVAVAVNTRFLERVGFYMKKAAIAIMNEAAGTVSHTERVTYAKKILSGAAETEVGVSIPDYSLGVMTNPTMEAAADPDIEGNGIVDNDLEFTINSMYNAYAGIATV